LDSGAWKRPGNISCAITGDLERGDQNKERLILNKFDAVLP
jgi:hypothetical protein